MSHSHTDAGLLSPMAMVSRVQAPCWSSCSRGPVSYMAFLLCVTDGSVTWNLSDGGNARDEKCDIFHLMCNKLLQDRNKYSQDFISFTFLLD